MAQSARSVCQPAAIASMSHRRGLSHICQFRSIYGYGAQALLTYGTLPYLSRLNRGMRGSENMNIAFKNRDAAFKACLAAVACGLIGFAVRVSAQNAPAPIPNRPVDIEASSTQGADLVADEKLKKRVEAALHADPYSYDKHVTVSIENGVVLLQGFVFSDWDLRRALNIARKAAGAKTVVDNLSIKEGGR
jgi:hypothetical protein